MNRIRRVWFCYVAPLFVTRKPCIRVFIVACLCLASFSCQKKSEANDHGEKGLVTRVGALKVGVAQDKLRNDPAVQNAIACLTADTTPTNILAQVDAGKFLVNHPSPAAIDILVMKAYSVRDPRIMERNVKEFPVGIALMKLGERAVPKTCERFETTSNVFEQSFLLDVLIAIKGNTWVVAYLSSLEAANKVSHTSKSFDSMRELADLMDDEKRLRLWKIDQIED